VTALLLLSHGAALAAEVRIDDGDEFVMPDGEVVRVDNIKAPSIGSSANCAIELQIGPPVLDRLRERRGRTEARVSVCGKDLGEVLVGEGLAIYRDTPESWCRSR